MAATILPPKDPGSIDSLEFVRQLVERGANVNARATRRPPLGTTGLNTVGATPFLLAARTADAALMRELAKLGADPLMPNADNTTPLMVAAGIGTNSPPEDPGTEAEVVEAIKVALELGNDINVVDKNGESVMHGAAYKQIPAAVRLLAQRGAKVEIWNQKNRKGWTPLKITQGVHRGMNIQKSPATEAAVREVMIAAVSSQSCRRQLDGACGWKALWTVIERIGDSKSNCTFSSLLRI